MERIIIRGGRQLFGDICLNGSKYSALAAIPACLVVDGPITFTNLPPISDVNVFLEIISNLGAKVRHDNNGFITIDSTGVSRSHAPDILVRRLRASYYLLGALLASRGEAEVALPGGDDIGQRPIDIHLKGLRALGARVEVENDRIYAKAKELRGASIYCDVPSVGATLNLMIAAVKAKGTTTIRNAYSAPWIVDVANFLNSQGALIRGAGTDMITIDGVSKLVGCTHSFIPDQTEAATFMLATAITGGQVRLKGLTAEYMSALVYKLREAGVQVKINNSHLEVIATGRAQAIKVMTGSYPGFYTDYQPMTTAWLATAEGTSEVTELVWPERFGYVDGLCQMGAQVQVKNGQALIKGVSQLQGASLIAGDIRAAAAYVLAGLGAAGTTEVAGINHLDRGYGNFEKKLTNLGAEIKRVAAQSLAAGGSK